MMARGRGLVLVNCRLLVKQYGRGGVQSGVLTKDRGR
jgi:hypothetical protein